MRHTQQAAIRSGASARPCAPLWRGKGSRAVGMPQPVPASGAWGPPGASSKPHQQLLQRKWQQQQAATTCKPALALTWPCWMKQHGYGKGLCLLSAAALCRLTNSIMMHGRNNGKKLMAVSSTGGTQHVAGVWGRSSTAVAAIACLVLLSRQRVQKAMEGSIDQGMRSP